MSAGKRKVASTSLGKPIILKGKTICEDYANKNGVMFEP